MRRCKMPGIPRGCAYWTLLDDEVCAYHRKVLDGLIDADSSLFRKPGVGPANVLSDEQLEIAVVLERLGAAPQLIKLALARSLPPGAGACGRA